MLGRCGLLAMLLVACGQSSDPASPSGTSAGAGQKESTSAPIPERADGAFRLRISASMAEGAQAPTGYRILRLPPRIEDFPPGAQVNRREVQKGSWRPYPGDGQALVVDLYPTEDVLADRWMVVAYAENDVHGFRYADNGFRRVEVGTSEVFALDANGGELDLNIAVAAPVLLQPEFPDLASVQGPFSFEFSYGPIAAAPRRIRGDWSGEGPLPFSISRYAIGREAYLSLFQQAWPAESEIGPVEFELADGITRVEMPQPVASGPLHLTVAAMGEGKAEPWAQAEVLGSFRGENGDWEIATAGLSDESGKLAIPNAQAGRYHLSARHSNGESVLLGWIATDGSEYEGRIATPPSAETGTLDLLNLPEAEGWEVEVWSFWGALMVGYSKGRPQKALTLPHAGEMRHQALARRYDPESGGTIAHLYLECEWHEGSWIFHAAPTSLSIENFTDDLGLVLRLNLTDEPEPEQFFPPKVWQVEPGSSETIGHFPVPFRGGLELHGLPEGQYEAGIWGLEPATGRMAELATFWPISEEVIEDHE